MTGGSNCCFYKISGVPGQTVFWPKPNPEEAAYECPVYSVDQLVETAKLGPVFKIHFF